MTTRIVKKPIDISALEKIAADQFGDLVKAVVDTEKGIMAIGGELHADGEALLMSNGSKQQSLWGINLYPTQYGKPDFVEFDSMINLRPSQKNMSRGVEDSAVREQILSVVERLVTKGKNK